MGHSAGAIRLRIGLVVVPYGAMKAGDGNMILPDATRDSPKSRPAFKYAS